jgi:hypothetical protein
VRWRFPARAWLAIDRLGQGLANPRAFPICGRAADFDVGRSEESFFSRCPKIRNVLARALREGLFAQT